jgi:hypothetical protein
MRRLALTSVLVVTALLAGTQGVQAQPFGTWLGLVGGATSGYIEIPHSSAFNTTGAFTIEAWVAITNSTTGEDCRSIAGKRYLETWWIGQCNVGGQPTLRSYLKGGGTVHNGGIIPRGVWTHVAVTFDGSTRRHYINGELAAQFAETGPLPTNGRPIRIGSDENWEHTPSGGIDEVRLWNVARSISQIRASLNQRITTAQPGLIAVWPFEGNTNDIIGGHNGSVQGSGVSGNSFSLLANCGASTATTLCLNTRHRVTAFWRTNPTLGTPPDGQAQVVNAPNPSSGLFWFFSSNNWEVMVKVLNGCGLNSRYWVFSAATTNVFYRVEVLDVTRGEQKIYFNYPGPPAPAVTDTNALATCP